MGRSQGEFSIKPHLRAEGGGKQITAVLASGERHERIAPETLLDHGEVRRSGCSQPRLRPRLVAGDKVYSSPTAPKRLRRLPIRRVIPTPSDQKRLRDFEPDAYRHRSAIDRLNNRLKQARRVATRYEKRADNYRTAVPHWLRPALGVAFRDTP